MPTSKFSPLQQCTWYNQGQVPFFNQLKTRLEGKGIKNIENYIGPLIKEDWPPKHIGVGITFKPRNYDGLCRKIRQSGEFQEDDRRTLVGAMAASATIGAGFRSFGSPSIHIAISKERVNIHLDKVGFLHIGASGSGFYGPDCLQHVVNELVLASILKLHGRRWKLRSILPTTSNKFRNVAGLGLSYRKEDFSTGKSTELGLRVQTEFTQLPRLGRNIRNSVMDPGAMITIFRSKPVQAYIGLYLERIF